MRFGAWAQKPPIKQWVVFDRGDLQMAKCECCGYELDVEKYRTVCSLPLACPRCRTKLMGFRSAEGGS